MAEDLRRADRANAIEDLVARSSPSISKSPSSEHRDLPAPPPQSELDEGSGVAWLDETAEAAAISREALIDDRDDDSQQIKRSPLSHADPGEEPGQVTPQMMMMQRVLHPRRMRIRIEIPTLVMCFSLTLRVHALSRRCPRPWLPHGTVLV
jgi:hypothetical protein